MHYDPLLSIPFIAALGVFALPLIGLVLVWTLLIKGFALWKAARNSHKAWFIVLLIVNSLGILELIYLIWFAKPNVPAAAAADSATPAA